MTMMRAIRAIAILVLAFSAGAAEPSAKVPGLLSHDELQKRLSDPALRLLDARPRADYDKGHLPGAVWANVKALQALTKAETLSDSAAWRGG